MINDGFGNELSAYEAWLHHRAHQMIQGTQVRSNAEDHDDLVQRGLIAMWQAMETFDESKGALPAWLTMKAAGAMKDSLRPAPTKHGSDTSLDEILDYSTHNRPGGGDNESTTDRFMPLELIEMPDLLAGVVSAYHRGEVARALESLTPKQREYVRLRFWEGAGTARLTEHFGYDPSALWNSKKNGAKYKLQAALAHLAPA